MMGWKVRLQRAGAIAVATGFLVGYVPVAPGTFGALVGLAIAWGLQAASLWVWAIVILGLAAAGVWASGEANRIIGQPDSRHIVIDEVVGILVTMVGIPVTGYWLVWGFLLFRFFDIVKLPPCNIFDTRLKNGWGVMLDDIAAGIYGNVVLRLMLRAEI